jgi:hypothetical protein
MDLNRGGLDSDNIPNGSKLIENSQPCDKEVTKGELVLLGSEKNVKDYQTSRSAICNLVNYCSFISYFVLLFDFALKFLKPEVGLVHASLEPTR